MITEGHPVSTWPIGAGDPRPVGVFDSGIGGLSVWREIAHLLPAESTIYFADQTHIPYGPRPQTQLRDFSETIVQRLLDLDCKAIVVACNSASAAALQSLRERFPHVPFVGMEPAIKPAARATRTGTVAVLATPATLQGELFAKTAERHAQGIQLIGEPCPGLVDLIENGAATAPETESLLRSILEHALKRGADHIVLACTHYPFVLDTIRRIVGAGVELIDPAPAVARQLARVLEAQQAQAPVAAISRQHRFITSGDPQRFSTLVRDLVHVQPEVETAQWRSDRELHLNLRSAAPCV